MIFLLDLVLLLNLFIAVKYFRFLFAPPVLLGTGMLLAALIATSYYELWEMKRLLFESVLILGGGPLIFTLFCILFNKSYTFEKTHVDVKLDDVIKLEIFYVVSILIGIAGTILKVKAYVSFWGVGSLPELVMAFREDTHSGDLTFKLPFYISVITRYTNTLVYFSSFIISLLVVYKNKNTVLKLMLILQIIVALFDGLLSGAKGAMIEVLVRFAVIYVIVLYWYYKSNKLPRNTYSKIFVIGAFFFLSFKGLGMLVGRNLEDRTNFDVLAEYCGAEIKNFDLYMHGIDGNSKSKFVGEDCFWTIYQDFNPQYVRYPRAYQNINGCHLGNVYTQYYSLHKDFGWAGIIIGTFLMSLICMMIYNNVLRIMKSSDICKNVIFIYSFVAMHIFMAFFSFRFSEGVITTNFLKVVILIYALQWVLRRFSILKIKFILPKELKLFFKYYIHECKTFSLLSQKGYTA